jgi:hypothetical protein
VSADRDGKRAAMADDGTNSERREELRSLDERIERLRAELDGLRDDPRDPGDQEDAALRARSFEEERALLDALQRRRGEVAAELGER